MIKHMKGKGIRFELVSEPDAIQMLATKNYYFKLTSYRKNFHQIDGKYENLDFAYLTDLASIDMQLRRYLLGISLDIEHGIKTRIIDLITKDPEEDGYSVVKDFSTFNQRGYDQTMKYLKRNDYLHDMYVKHRNHPSIWMFLEVATFGVLSRFVDFYYHRSRNKDVKLAHILLKYAKHIRNASAHNNAIMVNLFSAEEKVKHRNTTVVMFATKMGIDASLVTDMKVNDLVSLYSLHRRFSSVGSQELTRKEGQKLLKRASKHANYYTHEPVLIKFYQLFSKLINS
ncbi:hypothetical protein LBSG162_04570 [Lentilactobacillus buchneri subsp. silagei]|uniref:Abi family protein n=3 Tax=Lentilactobacillus buchneri TaxID=1581 RepID=J9W359_LENBU|nr:Abi family protein [Lentilactobacillus buchneri]AFR99439.1 hypothetical protein LBUCD034_0335 [Lentilactobacillus buchneri subsp. silagei CD034]BEJ53018.1 hypothetical protein Ltb232_11940 [Lentilactobacillus buchneri subsp. silagei]GED91352.1 hypothetical protein LBSG162_04570 [Lentilactobacillus buchneri subsp. silagei]GED93723.1 hypothetical protein LBSP_02830 [Lentilactobacillus buchneri subsp. silagei]